MVKAITNTFVAAVVMLAMTALSAPAVPAEPNDDPTKIAVYNININKMDREWEDWVEWIANHVPAIPMPDLILVQDMENATERREFQRYLTTQFGGSWFGRQGATGGRGWHTAVVWRGERFDPESVKKRGWWGFGDPKPKDGNPICRDIADGSSSEIANGSPAVQVRLRDTVADRYVSAVSFKTSGRETPKTCAWSNMKKVNSKLNDRGWSGGIMVMGTDANSSDRTNSGAWRCWYRGSNASITRQGIPKPGCNGQRNLRFYDPIYEKCAADPSRTIKTCLSDDHVTRNSIRIDFIFAKLRGGDPVAFDLQETETLPWRGDSGKAMTDHRTQRTVISY